MAESRLQRWSRRKAEAGKEAQLAPPPTVEPQSSPEEQELTTNQALPEHEVLEKYDLPDPDTIKLGTDITGFMRKEIPELLRRRALRALWKSNPVLAVLDGLNDYDEDFSNAATTVNGVQTLYRVGQGMFDKTARVGEQGNEQAEDQIQEQTEVSETIAPAGIAEREVVETGTGERELPERPESEMAAAPLATTHHVGPAYAEAEAEPAPHYRPRMRFDH